MLPRSVVPCLQQCAEHERPRDHVRPAPLELCVRVRAEHDYPGDKGPGPAHTAGVPDADDLRALARSSPQRWTTLRFTERRRAGWSWSGPVRAWLRRPDLLRVVDATGRPHVVRETGADHDPMWQDYRWVAELRPAELADGLDPDTGEPGGDPLEVDSVREVEHAGRRAWEALVVPTDRYEPRCACCPLLRSRRIDDLEWGPGSFPDAVYPTAHLVRLDAATGACVWAEALDGTFAGDTHDLRIEAVDEPMGDDLFRRARRQGAVRG